MSIQVARLPGNRLHLQHGPIDLVIGAEGAREPAFAAAEDRFATILAELTAELDLLRRPVTAGDVPKGAVARRMHEAARPFADGRTTPMVAVAAAVAETVLAAMTDAAPLDRAYVNNGGDIALHLRGAARFDVALATPDSGRWGSLGLTASDAPRGIATSGRGGRSHSLGIADAVTVLAPSAAMADAAATIIANAVDLPGHPAVLRKPARELRDDSDLGDAPVTLALGPLSPGDTARALEAGLRRATELQQGGLIAGAALFLRGQARLLGLPAYQRHPLKEFAYA